ncbi:MAG: 30S ribosomal protein S27e [Candidatus Micrarchaeia archaeon]
MGKFVLVKCNCGYEQPLYKSVKTVVKCINCGSVLAEPLGGNARILGSVKKELE